MHEDPQTLMVHQLDLQVVVLWHDVDHAGLQLSREHCLQEEGQSSVSPL